MNKQDIQSLHERIQCALDAYGELEGQSDPSAMKGLLEEADALLQEELKTDAGMTMVSARNALKALTESGYIPFASPCPSSNEVNIRITLRRAIENLEAAIKHHEKQFGKIK